MPRTAMLLLALWLLYLLARAFIGVFRSTPSSEMTEGMGKFRSALKMSAFVNLVTYLFILPFWLHDQHPRFGSFELVRLENREPEVEQVFVYTRDDGSIWLATTQGRQIVKVGDLPEKDYEEYVVYRTSEDGNELIGLIADRMERDSEYSADGSSSAPSNEAVPGGSEGNDGEWTIVEKREFMRYDLSSLAPSLRQSILANIRNGPRMPGEDEPKGFHSAIYTWRDGVMVEWRHRFFGSKVSFFPDTDRNCTMQEIQSPRREAVDFTGFVPPQRHLRIERPHILPGGRYVLLQCAGEIMLLDIERRKAIILFRGRDPVPLIKPTIFRNDLRWGPDDEENGPWEEEDPSPGPEPDSGLDGSAGLRMKRGPMGRLCRRPAGA